jgi:hypothetical protein
MEPVLQKFTKVIFIILSTGHIGLVDLFQINIPDQWPMLKDSYGFNLQVFVIS